ncbi:hypothetical protein CCR94_16330 [Rhodoblastus sphagnicola]|uniref:Mu-like prophage I protein n=1 Tax=Rhodoblastus sphagnicola TaxID=333368 RepID=A0A2S6N2Y5_9HYPH|nr:phage protease [Rhodoblastus sphagnicola]MBB4199062.1 phage I-like protein [Rhodoblastus sphagnicola]PPQ28957.1 hypothetical protein CCR94_16330 [Rhodoblastus sphagnicola]
MTTPRRTSLAHNSDAADAAFGAAVALNAEAAEGAPEWVQLLPAGPRLQGVDGRSWTLSDPQKMIVAFNRRGLDLPIDFEHAQWVKAPKGEAAPAAGWIEALEIRDGKIFGRVAWTQKGAAAINSREYRYLSPSFAHDARGELIEVVGAGLVNRPNFRQAALNQESISMKELLKKLGLPDTATENDAIAAVDRLQVAQNAQRPDPSLFVPVADYHVALNRASEAEKKIADDGAARLKAAAEAAVDQAIRDRKIAPTSRDYHLANCADQIGFDRFAAMVKDLPALLPDIDVQIDAQAGAQTVALNSDQQAVAVAMGLDDKAFAEFLSSQKK